MASRLLLEDEDALRKVARQAREIQVTISQRKTVYIPFYSYVVFVGLGSEE